MFEDHFLLGYVSGTHGLRGELKVQLDCNDPENYTKMESVFLRKADKLIPFFVEYLSLGNKGKAILALEEIENIDQAEEWKGSEIFLPLSELPELAENQFYYHEIMGFEARDQNNVLLGKIVDYYSESVQDLLAIDNNGKELLIPAIDPFISEVNKEEAYIVFELPDGYLDIYSSL